MSTKIAHRQLASGNIAILDSDSRVVAITTQQSFEEMANLVEPDRKSKLDRTPEQNRYARKVWVDLGVCATKYGYSSNKLSGFARSRAYRRIMRAAGIPTVINGKAHG